jgi:hypothetical protein
LDTPLPKFLSAPNQLLFQFQLLFLQLNQSTLQAELNTFLMKEALLKWKKLNILNRSPNTETLLNSTMLKQLNSFLTNVNSLTTSPLNTLLNKFLSPTLKPMLTTSQLKDLSIKLPTKKSLDKLFTQLFQVVKPENSFTHHRTNSKLLHQQSDKFP